MGATPTGSAIGYPVKNLQAATGAALTGAQPTTADQSLGLDIEANYVGYIAAIQIGSTQKPFRMLIDSGSADSWVASSSCTACGTKHQRHGFRFRIPPRSVTFTTILEGRPRQAGPKDPPLAAPRSLFSNSRASPAAVLVIGEKPHKRSALRSPLAPLWTGRTELATSYCFNWNVCPVLPSIGFSINPGLAITASSPSSGILPPVTSSSSQLISCPYIASRSPSSSSVGHRAIQKLSFAMNAFFPGSLTGLYGTDTFNSEIASFIIAFVLLRGLPHRCSSRCHDFCKSDLDHSDVIGIHNVF
ncbi:hypothetical protein A4X09_0g4886 [Tilletia walkeri]|uniref:Peptidase A1 domain-containing protein n=1 Tax=Tilletia walkeri TaxID=117179 RepID=A0A8X7N7K4_9BASI|nr:hypothetical protein A4X09_0g4886 [Tilletia walkeri]